MKRTVAVAEAVLAGGGLVVALAALPGVAGGPAVAAPVGPVGVAIPGVLLVAFLAAVGLAALLLVVSALPGRRRRRRDDKDFEVSVELPVTSPWLLPGMAALFLLVAATVVAVFVWLEGPRVPGRTFPGESFRATPAPAISAPPEPIRPAPVAYPLRAVGLLVSAAALGGLSLATWVWRRRRVRGSRTRPTPEGPEPTVDHSSFDAEMDPRRAVIACFQRFEQILARARIVREPSQTPRELMHEALNRLPLPRTAVQRLTDAFEIARFSDHLLGSEDSDSARTSLAAVSEALDSTPAEPADA